MIISDETRELLNQKGIYAIVNTADGKNTIYVGSTATNFKSRLKSHRSTLNRNISTSVRLQYAWNKYKEGSFWFLVLEVSGDTDSLFNREQFWLDKFKKSGDVYNTGDVAQYPRLGRKNSAESSRKVSEALRGRPLSLETRRKLSIAHMGLRQSPETIAKRVAKIKGRHRLLAQQTREAQIKSVSKPYPSFRNIETGQVIPAGTNLTKLCKECDISWDGLSRIMHNRQSVFQGWVVNG